MNTQSPSSVSRTCQCPRCQNESAAFAAEADEFGRWRRPMGRGGRRRPPAVRPIPRPRVVQSGAKRCPPDSIRGPFGVCLRSPIVMPQRTVPVEPVPVPLPPPLPDRSDSPAPAPGAWSAPQPPPPSAPAPVPGLVSGPSSTACGVIRYPVDNGNLYGPKWRQTRPPGLPHWARRSSAANAARNAVVCFARAQNLGPAFVNVMLSLADNESGGRFALPANIFNALPDNQRQGVPRITAWGVFQFNNPAWARDISSLLGRRVTTPAWQCTPQQEVELPIRFYARIYRQVLAAGGRPLDAARGVRLQHQGPTHFQNFLQIGRSAGFATAWNQVPAENRTKIERSLTKWGLASGPR